ncbi:MULTISPECIES: M16 family metallopeptidase [unclassified Brevundimonas]|uniref:M16 family metallopeptidase n=1 Tax=unclassified Brevundimonas TaxID=2622653 RepID=UPI0025C677BD|nr:MULTISPECIES: pitrilysin family protein [unclassified Brevundimonas]
MSIRLHTLSNGVRLICDPLPGRRTFALTVAVAGGARMESQGQSGWSHLLEHLVFKGAGDMGARDIVERIEAEGGTINAATGYERTSFEVRGVDGSLPLAMQVVSDLVFRPTLDPVEIEREKDVVAQEIAEAFDTPDDHVFEMAQTAAFDGQSLGRPILGSVDSLKPVNRDNIEAWRATLYSPDRMVVSVSGAVDEVELLKLAENWFGQAVATPLPELAVARFVGGHRALSRKIEQANLVFQIAAPGASSDDLHTARLFTEILGGGMASRLFQSAREERGLAYAIDAYLEPYADVGLLGIYAGAAAERSLELAEVCGRELVQLAEQGPSEAELSRAKAVLTAGLWMADESAANRAGRLATQTLVYGQPVPSDVLVAGLQAVTAEQMKVVGSHMLANSRPATAVLGPKAASKAGERFVKALSA